MFSSKFFLVCGLEFRKVIAAGAPCQEFVVDHSLRVSHSRLRIPFLEQIDLAIEVWTGRDVIEDVLASTETIQEFIIVVSAELEDLSGFVRHENFVDYMI